jgi:hypothetical protein
MMTTRDKLISLLSQIPTAKEIELHDGRVMVPDRRVEEVFADKIMALFASPLPGLLVMGEDASKAMAAALKELQIDPMRSMNIVPATEYHLSHTEEIETKVARLALDLAWYEAHEEKAEREGMQDLFAQIMTTSEAYVTRFGGEPSMQGALTKMQEEFAELIEAVDEYRQCVEAHHSAAIEQEAEINAAREAIDLLVTVGGFLWANGIDHRHIDRAAHDTLAKLDARTPATHAWNPDTNTVERVGKVTP